MLLLMVIAAVVSVTQLAVLGSYGRSLRLTTLWQGIAVGFLVCGFVTVTIQFAWTRLAAALTSTPVAEIQDLASWTVDPAIEEIVKVAPLLLLAWLRVRQHRQLGYTDHLLYGAALGMGFELLESALRFARLGAYATGLGGLGDRYVVDGGLFGVVTVPTWWRSLTSWLPVPAANEEFLSPSGDSIQHLVWSALAGLGIAWLVRRRDVLRLLGLGPLLLATLDHANYNLRVQLVPPLAGWWSDALAWVGAQLSWVLVVALIAAVVADRVVQLRGRRASPALLLPGEAATGSTLAPLIRSATAGAPWSAWVTWHFVLSRRAALTAFTAGEPEPHLRDGVSATAAQLAQIASLPRGSAQQLWRAAARHTWSGIDLRALLSWRMIVWAASLLPAALYLVVGAFPSTAGLQEAMTSQVGLWLLVLGVLAGGALVVSQVRPMLASLRAVTEPSLHERRLRPQAQLATAIGALGGGLFTVVLAVLEREPTADLVRSYHVLDAISNALLVLGLALVLGSFFLFPPLGMVAVAGGGVMLVPTAAAGSFVITLSAGAILASAGVLMNDASGSGGGGSGSGNPPPRHTSSSGASRTYGNSVGDIRSQAQRYAARMRRQGYHAEVPPIRYNKYGEGAADFTVKVTDKFGNVKHIRHFIYKGK